MFGVELGARMTVIDLDGQGELFVHSPIRLTEAVKNQLSELGTVKYVVAPNKWHHLFIADFKREYPNAQFFCAPGLETKKSDFKFDGVINGEQTFPWNSNLEHKLVEGVPIFNEVVFYHGYSKTLILTDLAIHICRCDSLYSRIILKLIGSYGKFGWAKLEKKLYIRDKSAFRTSIDHICEWDFEKILLTHGLPLTENGKSKFIEAFKDL
jgi:hypothetical protein